MPIETYVPLANATYLDLTSFQGNAPLPSSNSLLSPYTINVALVFERANDPTPLLESDWATRHKTLESLKQSGTLWSTYGADKDDYQKVLDKLGDLGITTLNVNDASPHPQYISTAESRTIWVQLDQTNFTTLFGPGTELRDGGANAVGDEIIFWEGSLSLPEEIADAGVVGLWFDTGKLSSAILADTGGTGVTLPQGPQSPGNTVFGGEYPNVIAARYNFPFANPDDWTTVETGRVGLIEPGMGTALLSGTTGTFDEHLQVYRGAAGIPDPPKEVLSVAGGGQVFTEGDNNHDERSLDVGIVATVNPQTQLILYAGSGHDNSAGSDPFTAYQSAIWDLTYNPGVLSSSFSSYQHVSPGSPFYFAQQQLFIDAALREITVVNAAGDGGSGAEYPNGLTSVEITHASAYSLVAGGASLSTVDAAGADTTLSTLFAKAMAGHRSTIWSLVSGGLKVLPAQAAADATFVETAWNAYSLSGNVLVNGGYLNNEAGAGGVDVSQPTPGYQTAFGLTPTASYPGGGTGRGIPDVAATSGGNMAYAVPWPDFQIKDSSITKDTGGTSAAAPLWASLMAQVNTIFEDQDLPRLGYMNDLLYIAAVIAPAAFNDVTIGSNTSSALVGGSYYTAPKGQPDPTLAITPTGYGYAAGQGYDLVSGLGTPNGVLLARAMTWIAHDQMSASDIPDVLAPTAKGWGSPTKQTLLVQTTSGEDQTVKLLANGGKVVFDSVASKKFAWTSQFAQQTLQADFDPKLVKMFDGQSQGGLVEQKVQAGSDLAVKIDGEGATTPQAGLSAAYGFADFVSPSDIDSSVRVARPVAVAETVGGADDQIAVVRMRQGGKDDVILKLYRVDDFKGTIDGLKPGEKGYNAAANERAYETAGGKGRVKGPGYTQYREKEFAGFDDGDIVAMKLKSGGKTYWAFAQANEKMAGEHVGHIWNYGVNTWGWESDYKGGDRDFNDLVVQIDFTSAYGHGWLV
ncbi:MAG: S53 family peptidase [Bauldia sp.]|nr:S53 family peptidase [Bauldia sp.]